MSIPRSTAARRSPMSTLASALITIALVAPAAAATATASASAAAAVPASGFIASSTASGQLVPVAAGEGGEAPPSESVDFSDGRYVVLLKEAPAALYSGAVAGLNATDGDWDGETIDDRDSQAYLERLSEQQDEIAESVGADANQQFGVTSNGFVADLSADQASRIASDPRVARVIKNEIIPLASTGTSTDFLGLSGTDGVWAGLGGTETLGEGIVVGVIDTGIAPENPSFAGSPMGATPGDAPYRDGDAIVYAKSDGGTFRGTCETGEQFTLDDCSTKIVGARSFVEGFGASQIGGPVVGEYRSPRDGNGHGSHTGGTAVGNPKTTVGDAAISGVTPQAKIAVYKSCWSGPVPESGADDGCATADLLSAIEAATSDGVDVINYSIGGAAANSTNSVIDQAFMAAASTGIFVAAAAGNSGPDSSTLDNASPWITTVAASTIPAEPGTVELGDGRMFLGATVTVPEAGVTGRFVSSTAAARSGREADAAICAPGSLDPARVANTIVLCERGQIDRAHKSAEVANVGGIGMVLINPTPSSVDVDDHAVPTIHLDSQAFEAVSSYAATTDATVTLRPGRDQSLAPTATPQIAGFSSRGPVLADGSDLIKPDIAAPGTTILAATSNAEGANPNFGYMSGTSMASPHIAGLAAMYLSQHPVASPAEIKSALMTTATDTVDATGAPARDPFAQGNGQVHPAGFLEPGLVYLNEVNDWQSYLKSFGEGPDSAADEDASNLNIASIGVGALPGSQSVVRTVTATAPGDYEATITGLDGIDTIVEPSTLHFDEIGEQHQFTVTFTRAGAALDEFSTGYLAWRDNKSDITVRSALAVQPVAFDADTEVLGSGATGSVDIDTRFGDAAEHDIDTVGLARGSRVNGSGTVGAEPQRFAIAVDEGTELLRISLDSVGEKANLDLRVWGRNPDGSKVPILQSVTASGDEMVEIEYPLAATYVAEVLFTGGDSDAALGYTLSSYALDIEAPDAAFTVAPERLSGGTGEVVPVRASWSDLSPGTYLGIIGYGATGVATAVTIDAGTQPVAPGTPQLSVSPSETEWLLGDAELRVTGTSLTPDAAYEATIDKGPAVRRGTANEDGLIDWLVSSVEHSGPGLHTLRLTGPGIDEERRFRTSPVTFAGGYVSERPTFAGNPAVTLEAFTAGRGVVRFEMRNEAGVVVTSDDVDVVPEALSVRSNELEVPAGRYSVTATALHMDGSPAAVFAFDPMELAATDPSSIEVFETDTEGIAQVYMVNNTGLPERGRVTYVACDGSRVFASEVIASGESIQQWRLVGTSSVVVTDRFERVVWRSDHPEGCDGLAAYGDPIGQDLWITATAASGDDLDPQRLIALELGYRYEPNVDVYNLSVGEGARADAQPFLRESVPVPSVSERGPISRRALTAPEETRVWANVQYFARQAGNEVIGSDELGVDPLLASDLVPGRTVVTPGTAAIAGNVRVGQAVRAETSGWFPADVALTYLWQLDGTPVSGPTTEQYTPGSDDAGRLLSVRVTGTARDGGAASVVSASLLIQADPHSKNEPAGPRSDGALAYTGGDLAHVLPLIAAAVAMALVGGSLVRRRRRAS